LSSCLGWPFQIVPTTLLLGLEALLVRFYKLFARSSSIEFEPIEEVSSVVPLVLFGFTFAFTNPPLSTSNYYSLSIPILKN